MNAISDEDINQPSVQLAIRRTLNSLERRVEHQIYQTVQQSIFFFATSLGQCIPTIKTSYMVWNMRKFKEESNRITLYLD